MSLRDRRTNERLSFSPLKLALFYVLIGALWIFASDRLIQVFSGTDISLYLLLQTYKGWFFVLASGILLYFMADRLVRAVRESRYRISFEDPLTGLPNRAMLRVVIQEKMELHRSHPESTMALILLKLKNLRRVNESLGHAAGDRVLIEAAERILEVLHQDYTLARIAGDTFAILSLEGPMPRHAVSLVQDINSRITVPIQVQGHQVQLQIHCGIVCPLDRYTRAESVLRDSEIALHHARQRNELFHIFQTEYHQQALERIRLEEGLRTSLQKHRFLGRYQPIIALEDGSIQGMECLVRWAHNDLVLDPETFLSVAEDTLLIRDMGKEIFARVCKDYGVLHQAAGGDSFFISFNLSWNQIIDPELAGFLRSTIDECRIPPGSIKLEITETSAMQNIPATSQIFQGLKEEGFGLAIDDFGTGYSSLEYLERFPFETLKIDKGFIHEMELSASKRRIVQTIVSLAGNLGMRVVAEGVENELQKEALLRYGGLWGQGFHLCPPLSAEEIVNWATRRTSIDV